MMVLMLVVDFYCCWCWWLALKLVIQTANNVDKHNGLQTQHTINPMGNHKYNEEMKNIN